MEKALCFVTIEHSAVRCDLCRHGCTIADGGRGICRVRENRGGQLYSLVSGLLVAEQIDPIEKKPLYHVLPGSRSYSIALWAVTSAASIARMPILPTTMIRAPAGCLAA